MYCGIINDEKLIEKVNWPLVSLREELVAKGYSYNEADNAIALSLPVCIMSAVIDSARSEFLSKRLDRNREGR